MTSRLYKSPRPLYMGFSLIEVLVALFITATALLAIIRVVISSAHGVGAAQDYTIAAGLAQRKLAEFKAQPTPSGSELMGRVELNRRSFTWRSRSFSTAWPEVQRLEVAVRWMRGGRQRDYGLETLSRTDRVRRPGAARREAGH